MKAEPSNSNPPPAQQAGRARNEMLVLGDFIHDFVTQFENAVNDGALLEGSFHDEEFWKGDREV